MASPVTALNPQTIYAGIQDHYGSAAVANNTRNNEYGHTVASAFGYSPSELATAPLESNLGLSCGNPFAIANLREGETVVDLGSGAGFDVFQAAKKVGVEGRVWGVDMNDDMLSRANAIKQKTKAENTTFVKSKITNVELLEDEMSDCVISNCVVNLVPEGEKQLAFNEMFRLLKPKGRVAISDILIKKELTDELKNNMALYVGCVAGASTVEGYERYLREAGFGDIMIVGDNSDLNVYKTAGVDGTEAGCCGPISAEKPSCCGGKKSDDGGELLKDLDLNEWAGSFKIFAVKA